MNNLRTEPIFSGFAITKKGKAVQRLKKDKIPYSREYENSPTFTFVNSILTTGASETIDIHQDNTASQKYGVMNILTIANSSTEAIRIYPNQDKDRYFTIPSGSIRVLDQYDLNAGLLSFRVYNAGTGTAGAGTITFEVYKKGITTQGLTQQFHKKIFPFFRS